ncbi:MAG: Ig-like domain-containing protein, partial [Candidatus Zixiibacteriota bacterium]
MKNNNYGIYVYRADNSVLSRSRVDNNSYGILLYFSSNDNLDNNTLENNRYNFGVNGDDISHTVHNVDNSNTVNGKSIVYLVGKKNLVINQDNSIGFLGLVQCDNLLVENILVENSLEGIFLAGTENSIIRYNTFNNNYNGILLYLADNNLVSNHVVTNSFWNGATLTESNGNIFSNNTVESSGNYDVYVFSGSYNNTLQANVHSTSYGTPRIASVGASNITTNSATITWTTVENSTGEVEYGTTISYGFTATDGTTTSHSVGLSALSANTTYHYRVKSKDNDNNLVVSSDYTLTTSSPPPSKTNTTVTMDASSFSLVSGGSRTLTATLKDNTGNPLSGKTVSWSKTAGSLSTTSGATNSSGQASVTFTAQTVTTSENVTITASFAGDSSYNSSSGTSAGTIYPVPTVTSSLVIVPSSFTIGSGENVVLTATLTFGGGPIAGRTISWSKTAGSLSPATSTTNSSGQATVTFAAPDVTAQTTGTIT